MPHTKLLRHATSEEVVDASSGLVSGERRARILANVWHYIPGPLRAAATSTTAICPGLINAAAFADRRQDLGTCSKQQPPMVGRRPASSGDVRSRIVQQEQARRVSVLDCSMISVVLRTCCICQINTCAWRTAWATYKLGSANKQHDWKSVEGSLSCRCNDSLPCQLDRRSALVHYVFHFRQVCGERSNQNLWTKLAGFTPHSSRRVPTWSLAVLDGLSRPCSMTSQGSVMHDWSCRVDYSRKSPADTSITF